MTNGHIASVERDLWPALRRHTQARIGLGRAGSGLPTQHRLELQAAHAAARDAVHSPFQPELVGALRGSRPCGCAVRHPIG